MARPDRRRTIGITLNAAGFSTHISGDATSIALSADGLPTQISTPIRVMQTGRYDGASRATHVDAIRPAAVSAPLNNAYDCVRDRSSRNTLLLGVLLKRSTNCSVAGIA